MPLGIHRRVALFLSLSLSLPLTTQEESLTGAFPLPLTLPGSREAASRRIVFSRAGEIAR